MEKVGQFSAKTVIKPPERGPCDFRPRPHDIGNREWMFSGLQRVLEGVMRGLIASLLGHFQSLVRHYMMKEIMGRWLGDGAKILKG